MAKYIWTRRMASRVLLHVPALLAGGIPAWVRAQAPAPARAAAAAAAEAPAPAQAASQAPTVGRAQPQAGAQSGAAVGGAPLETVTVVGKLDQARSGIETQLGASTYDISSADIDKQPGGANVLMNQVILQAPSVAQDSFGQMHVRGDHNGLQYRLNGVILPEGLSSFGQTLDPRLISSVKLITGALPAEYGLRTAGIIDISTRSGALEPGGEVSIYGGSHGRVEPSFSYGGSSGDNNYFVSADYLHDGLGIESPDGSASPLHDTTTQFHGFAYLEHVLSPKSRLTFVAGTSNDYFQIPNAAGQVPDLGLAVEGRTNFASSDLDERQREVTRFGTVTYQRSGGSFNVELSGLVRDSLLDYSPDPVGDLLFDGIAQKALKRDRAYGLQAEGAYYLGNRHTLRAGVFLQSDQATSATTSLVLPVDAAGDPTSDVPLSIVDNGAKSGSVYSVYLQDAWAPVASLTVNYGLRFDRYSAYTSGSQLSPRLNLVWSPTNGATVVHIGAARYFSPPPFELVGNETVSKFVNTTAAAPLSLNDAPVAESADYYDVGASRRFGDAVTFGVDTYYKVSRNLIDEGQFGAPIILTPFNYAKGKQYGIEFTGNYQNGRFSAYGNLAVARAFGRDIVSSQFQFDPADLAYIADHYIHLDHDQALTASGGVSYTWAGSVVSMDLVYGSGLRADGDVPNGAHVPAYTQVNLGVSHTFTGDGPFAGFSIRSSVVNVFDSRYEIRTGTGVGVGAPQWGPSRGVYLGLSRAFRASQ